MPKTKEIIQIKTDKTQKFIFLIILIIFLIATIYGTFKIIKIYQRGPRKIHEDSQNFFEPGSFDLLTSACEGKTENDLCEIANDLEILNGVCKLTRENDLVCIPDRV